MRKLIALVVVAAALAASASASASIGQAGPKRPHPPYVTKIRPVYPPIASTGAV